MPLPTKPQSSRTVEDRIAGAALLTEAGATVFVMAHHPTNAEMASLPPVHATLLVLSCLTTLGFLHLCATRGFSRLAILAGLVGYAVAFFGNLGAGLINGLITPSLLEQGAGIATPDVMAFAWASNQTLATMAVFGAGAAFVLWGLDLLRGPSIRTRALGLAGIAAGVIPSGLLLTGLIEMDIKGAMLSYAIHAAWAALVGLNFLVGQAGSAGTPQAASGQRAGSTA